MRHPPPNTNNHRTLLATALALLCWALCACLWAAEPAPLPATPAPSQEERELLVSVKEPLAQAKEPSAQVKEPSAQEKQPSEQTAQALQASQETSRAPEALPSQAPASDARPLAAAQIEPVASGPSSAQPSTPEPSTPAPVSPETSSTAPASSPIAAAPAQPAVAEPALPVAGSVSLSAPLEGDKAQVFAAKGPGAQAPVTSAVDLHPPGRFSTAEPLNPSTENLLRPDPPAPPPAPLAPATPLRMLDVEVPPGSASRLAWSPQDSFSGIAMPTPVLVVHGAKPGPRLCLTAAVHGDEVNGIEVVRNILYNLDPHQLAGTVIGVPIVNMQGFRRSSRYLADRRDLNRFFPGNPQGSSASRIAYGFFNEVVVHCQLLVDLHTGSLARTNLPQLRADLNKPKVVALAKDLGDIAVLQNRGAKGSLRRAAVDRGIAAVTLEAGEPHTFQEAAINKSVQSIQHLLVRLGMYAFAGITPKTDASVFYRSQWVRAKAGGMLFNRVTLGQQVQAGEWLGTILDPITNQSSQILSPRTGLIIGMALNQVMHPGFAAYHIGYPTTLSEASQSDAGPEDFGADAAVYDTQEHP